MKYDMIYQIHPETKMLESQPFIWEDLLRIIAFARIQVSSVGFTKMNKKWHLQVENVRDKFSLIGEDASIVVR